MLGVSVYFQDLNLDYLEQIINSKVKFIFTSLHIDEEDYSDLEIKIDKFLKLTKQNDVVVAVDVSPKTLSRLKVDKIEDLASLGFSAFRLDYGFDKKQIVSLSHKFKIVINASTVEHEYLKALLDEKINVDNVIACHNFYPGENMGMDKKRLIELNLVFNKYGIKVQAFVPGDKLKRFPFHMGLPTLEKHRYMDPYVAAVELYEDCLVDQVIIGDSEAKIETLNKIREFKEENIISLKTKLDEKYAYLYDTELTIRPDLSADIIRVISNRSNKVGQANIFKRYKGAITIGNEYYGRYNGDIQIVKNELDADYRINIIGQVELNDIQLLSYVKSDTKVRLIK